MRHTTPTYHRHCLTVASVVSVESAPRGIRMDECRPLAPREEPFTRSVKSTFPARGLNMRVLIGNAKHKYHVGHLHLTVETEPVDIDRSLERHRRLADVTRELLGAARFASPGRDLGRRRSGPLGNDRLAHALGNPARSGPLGRSPLARPERRPQAIRQRARPPRVASPRRPASSSIRSCRG